MLRNYSAVRVFQWQRTRRSNFDASKNDGPRCFSSRRLPVHVGADRFGSPGAVARRRRGAECEAGAITEEVRYRRRGYRRWGGYRGYRGYGYRRYGYRPYGYYGYRPYYYGGYGGYGYPYYYRRRPGFGIYLGF
jgi:hypothetical protein